MYTSATILVIPIVSDTLQNIQGFSLVLRRLPQQNMFNKKKVIKKKKIVNTENPGQNDT